MTREAAPDSPAPLDSTPDAPQAAPEDTPLPADPHAAIEALMEEHGGKVYALGLRMCGSPEQAEDLLQETFLNAFRGWREFEGRARATTWLYTIAKRACMRMRRPRAGEPKEMEALEDLLPGRDGSVADFGVLSGTAPGGTAGVEVGGLPSDEEAAAPFRDQLAREARATVEAALAELPMDFRLPLVLVDIAELSTAEAAEVLGIPRNTVKTRLHRGRLKLRQAIDAGLPQKKIPSTQASEVCFAMLQAKQEALDRDVPFPYPDAAICDRCRSVFAALDLGRDACLVLGKGELPPAVQERLREALAGA